MTDHHVAVVRVLRLDAIDCALGRVGTRTLLAQRLWQEIDALIGDAEREGWFVSEDEDEDAATQSA